MLKQQAALFNRITQIIDIVLIMGAFAAAHAIRNISVPTLGPLLDHLWIMLVVLPTWHFLMSQFYLYASIRTLSIPQIIISLIKVHLIGGIITASAIYLIQPHGFRRILFMLFILLSFVTLAIGKLLLKGILSYMRRRGYNTRNLLIIGSKERRSAFIQLIREHTQWGLCISGIYQPQHPFNIDSNDESPPLGNVDNLVAICKSKPVDEVIFCLNRNEIQNIDDYVFEMEQMGITVRMVLDVYEVHRTRREVAMFHGEMPILTLHCMMFDATQLFFKRCLDVFGSIIGLIINCIMFPFIALAIKLDSPGPLMFGQERVGEHGRLFTCWKYRSMYVDAEDRKKDLSHLNEMQGAIFKIKNDPRITRVGHFIRKTSLDELPQFWNVLCGDMSLVGTRPPTPDEVSKYENWHRRRISIKPGITGLWQISGRNQIQDFDSIVRLDLEYIDKWNIWLDIRILIKTVKVVFVREGSC
ncbi:MAG: exopolysaccharide biosynthesis polyprenyl glycosylphosphotransferase [Geobacter sp.]|nr:exopolysaccharide biosynthesis polyprenyl glycosylphosphotransferase [Geobacter sp.]